MSTAAGPRPGGRHLSGLLLVAGLLAALPATGEAALQPHDPWKLEQGRALGDPLDVSVTGRCDVCHTLDDTEGEPGTSFIVSSARTLNAMVLYRGGPFVIDDYLGCTFCHSNVLDNVSMDDVLTDFEFTGIKHPMGRKVDGVTNTNNEFLSTVDSADVAGTPAQAELQCINCHDPAILWPGGLLTNYPYHEGKTDNPGTVWDGTWNPTSNPNALRNVTVAGDAEKNHCVSTCHGDLGPGNSTIKPRMGHYDWGAYDGTTLSTPGGRAIAVAGSTCTTCHDTHTSTKEGLLQDGVDRGEPDPGRTAIVETACTAVCHAAAGFVSHGHGAKAGFSATACTPCHSSATRHRDTTDPASVRRLSWMDPAMATLARDRSSDGLDNDLSGVRDDAAETAFAYPRTANCLGCHMNYAGHGSATRAASCLDCHDVHGSDAAASDNAAMIRSTLFGEATVFTAADRAAGAFYRTGPATGVCDNDACHGNIAGGLATEHRGGTGAVLDQPCSDCHVMSHTAAPGSDESFKADCTMCHGPGGTGPTVVWPAGNASGKRTAYGSHLGATAAEESGGFLGGLGGAWGAQCGKCHAGHSGAIQVPAPPTSWSDPSGRLSGANMRSSLGLPYALEANVAIHLGGSAQGGASEAEFCWGCHDANGVSEWGFNTKTTPTGFPVVTFATAHDGSEQNHDYGWIYTSTAHATKTSDWTAGYWQDEYELLVARRIASVHSASFDPAGQSSSVAANVIAGPNTVNRSSPTYEARPYLRCSYCHDVHDTFGPDGKPYLRGRWVGNPYPPELPPQSTYGYTTYINTITGARTPRALSTSRDKGGYFLDQNSGWPTNNGAMDTVAETAELCTLCHGTNVDTMDFYGGSKLWRATTTNGHSNSTLGGTGSARADLFTGSRYGYGMAMQLQVPNTPWVCGPYGGECDLNYPQSTMSEWACEFDCSNLRNSGWFGGPVGSSTRGGGDFANWYGSGTIGGASGTEPRAHKFTCSKCHTPHASGLPALLIHNCIDPALSNFTINGQGGANLIANNCHRKTSVNDGWHILAPGQ